jgi:spore maturation protein CgeB
MHGPAAADYINLLSSLDLRGVWHTLVSVRSRRNLPRTFYIGGYGWRGKNDMVYQMMLGIRSTGAEFFEFDTDAHAGVLDTEGRDYDRGTTGPVWLRWPVVRPYLERFQPELVVCNAGGLSFRPGVAAELQRRSVKLLGIALSDPDVFTPTTMHIARNFDIFATNAPACVPEYRRLGANPVELPIATTESFFHPVPPRAEMACDVLILGRASPDRILPVRELVRRFHTHVYGEGWEEHGVPSRGLIYGDDVLAALNSASVVVVFSRTPAGHCIVKVGLFDFLAAGALVATESFPELARYFHPGRDLIAFTDADTGDLIRQIDHYLGHPDEAAEIRKAGREHVLKEHTWKKVWPHFLSECGLLRGA